MCKESRMSKKMFLMLCDAPAVRISRGTTHNTPNVKWISNVGNDAGKQVLEIDFTK